MPITDPDRLAVCVKPVGPTGAGHGVRMPVSAGALLARPDRLVKVFASNFRKVTEEDLET